MGGMYIIPDTVRYKHSKLPQSLWYLFSKIYPMACCICYRKKNQNKRIYKFHKNYIYAVKIDIYSLKLPEENRKSQVQDMATSHERQYYDLETNAEGVQLWTPLASSLWLKHITRSHRSNKWWVQPSRQKYTKWYISHKPLNYSLHYDENSVKSQL